MSNEQNIYYFIMEKKGTIPYYQVLNDEAFESISDAQLYMMDHSYMVYPQYQIGKFDDTGLDWLVSNIGGNNYRYSQYIPVLNHNQFDQEDPQINLYGSTITASLDNAMSHSFLWSGLSKKHDIRVYTYDDYRKIQDNGDDMLVLDRKGQIKMIRLLAKVATSPLHLERLSSEIASLDHAKKYGHKLYSDRRKTIEDWDDEVSGYILNLIKTESDQSIYGASQSFYKSVDYVKALITRAREDHDMVLLESATQYRDNLGMLKNLLFSERSEDIDDATNPGGYRLVNYLRLYVNVDNPIVVNSAHHLLPKDEFKPVFKTAYSSDDINWSLKIVDSKTLAYLISKYLVGNFSDEPMPFKFKWYAKTKRLPHIKSK